MSQDHPIQQQVAKFLADKQAALDRGDITSSQTVLFYGHAVGRIFLPWALERGITDASALTVAQWNAYRDELRGRDLAKESMRTYLRGLRILLVSLGFSREKMKGYDFPKASKAMLDTLTREEIDRLEDAADNERDKLIIRTLANTGIRLGELTRLKLKDLKVISSPARYYYIRVWGKGSKEREVPIDQPTFKRLDTYARTGGDRTYVFPALQHDRKTGALVNLDGTHLSNNAVDRMFRERKKAAGITKPCTPHKLRHAYATEAKRRGMDDQELMRILGHADTGMITRVYTHLDGTDLSRAYERTFGGRAVVEQEEPKKRRRIA